MGDDRAWELMERYRRSQARLDRERPDLQAPSTSAAGGAYTVVAPSPNVTPHCHRCGGRGRGVFMEIEASGLPVECPFCNGTGATQPRRRRLLRNMSPTDELNEIGKHDQQIRALQAVPSPSSSESQTV